MTEAEKELVRVGKLAAQKMERTLASYRVRNLAAQLDPTVTGAAELALHHDMLVLQGALSDLKDVLQPFTTIRSQSDNISTAVQAS